jgi:hypothetical protein
MARPNMRMYQLRQELVMTGRSSRRGARVSLLASTKPPATAQPTADARGPRAQFLSDDNLEQQLLGRIAALDPKLAAQNADQMMDKGQFPTTIPSVIDQVYKQDAAAAEKLADRTVKKIEAANILAKPEAANLIQALLSAGPRPTGDKSNATSGRSVPVLGQSLYVDLLSTVVDAALKATPSTQNNPRANLPVRRGGIGSGNSDQPPTDAQIEQNNARRLLAGCSRRCHDRPVPAVESGPCATEDV